MSVISPAKPWFRATEPLSIEVKHDGPVTLMLTDFNGRILEARANADVVEPRTVDVRSIWVQLAQPGVYVLWAVPKDARFPDFVGTPLVIDVRRDDRRDATPGPMVVRVQPLRYAKMVTEMGEMTLVFYYNSAPNTVENFLRLSEDKFYDGLTFHRVVPGFVIQGGDPRGDSSGGPGYSIDAEFNDREHREGVLSMAREGDPLEPQALPRCEYANSAGSQFFICLNYARTQRLDRRYTAFGQVATGMDVVDAIGKVPVGGESADAPTNPPVIQSVTVHRVTPGDNPYETIMVLPRRTSAATVPTTIPTTRPATPAGQ
jgi:cyclophilin family peptidyl-prolyl cis-trans isomerase